MSPARFDLLGAGAIAVDDLLYVPEFPRPESKTRVQSSVRQVGGLTAAALIAAARLGARCAFAGVLGTDPLSELAVATLAAEGVDVGLVVRRETARPRHSTIIVELAGGGRTILVDTADVDEDPEVPAGAVVRDAAVLFLDHTHPARMLRLARAAAAAGLPTVADYERDNVPGLGELLALTGHLVLPWSLARTLTGAGEPAAAVSRLWTKGRAAVVVTAGEQGAWYLAAGSAGGAASAGPVLHQSAFRVPVADTTGCGDVFHGAYAAALAHGLPAADRVRLASAAAALKATRRGLAGIPTAAEVRRFLASQ